MYALIPLSFSGRVLLRTMISEKLETGIFAVIALCLIVSVTSAFDDESTCCTASVGFPLFSQSAAMMIGTIAGVCFIVIVLVVVVIVLTCRSKARQRYTANFTRLFQGNVTRSLVNSLVGVASCSKLYRPCNYQ
jgi:hypothetical protein